MKDGERSILRQALRCGFLGNSQQRARKSPGGPLGDELLSQGFRWEKSHLAGYTGGHGSEGRLVLRNHRELENEEGHGQEH